MPSCFGTLTPIPAFSLCLPVPQPTLLSVCLACLPALLCLAPATHLTSPLPAAALAPAPDSVSWHPSSRRACVDQWLSSRRLCPFCKHDASLPTPGRSADPSNAGGAAAAGGRGTSGGGGAAAERGGVSARTAGRTAMDSLRSAWWSTGSTGGTAAAVAAASAAAGQGSDAGTNQR
jgi:hypothetical protein